MKILYFSILATLLSSSCDFPKHYFTDLPECVYKSDQHNIHLSLYNYDSVVKTLSTYQPNQFRYKFIKFLENEKYKLLVNFRNENICLDVLMKMDTLGKLEGMYRTNGYSYPKELYDMKWHIKNNGNS